MLDTSAQAGSPSWLPPSEWGDGKGALVFGRSGPGTRVMRAYARSPLRLLNPRNHGNAAWVYTSTYGGGLVGGDVIDLDVQVEAGSAALLSTQASTKVYRSQRPSTQRLTARVESDGLLVIVPDPVVCFAGSRFVQRQQIRLAADASLLLVDWLSAGRHASGERWAFDSYLSQIEIWVDERRRLYESVCLDADAAVGALPERLGRFNTLAVVVLLGPKMQAAAEELLRGLVRSPSVQRPELYFVGSPLQEAGALLRLGGVSVEAVGAALRESCRFLGPLLGDDPWLRKW